MPPSWKDLIVRLADTVDRSYDRLTDWVASRRPAGDPMRIEPYLSYGVPERLTVIGRILEDEGLEAATDDDSVWDNVLAMLRRFESDEIGGAHVEATFGPEREVGESNGEGYFCLSVTPPEVLAAGWHEVTIAAESERHGSAGAVARVLVPSPDAEFGVISDIDDTVISTDAHRLGQMVRTVLTGNARTRLPFTGVAALYEALQSGSNPLFYVSNGPWNLFDFLTEFMEVNGIPPGPILLRDYGFDRTKFLTDSTHKARTIGTILATYPDLPFVLIGDSGEKDPEIYAAIVEEHPGRIAAIYIRDVTGAARDAGVNRLAEAVGARGVPMLLAADSAVVALDAEARGLIPANTAALVTAAVNDEESSSS